MKKAIIIAFVLILTASPCLCLTRFYFLSSGATPEVLPSTANQLGWTNVSTLKTFSCTSKKIGTPLVAYQFPSQAGNNKTIINCRYISPPLQAQTISGSVEGQTKGFNGAPAKTIFSQVGIYVINKFGTTEVTLLPLTSGAGLTSFSTIELTNLKTPTKTALTSGACSDGARLVIEIGSVTGPAGSGTTSQEVGDASNTDLPIDETTVGNYSGWIEFSNLIITKSQSTLIE